MRWGFKSACEKLAEEHRHELGLALHDPLDAEALASRLGVTVWWPKDVPNLSPDCLRQLTVNDRDAWSAVTLRVGREHLTIVNSSHPLTRQRNSVVHELAHLLLEHEPNRIDVSKKGFLLLNSFEGEQEKEADWLSGALLVPREGLRKIFHRTQNPKRLATHFDVSPKLLEWRLRMTGVAVQARRANAYRNRAGVKTTSRRASH